MKRYITVDGGTTNTRVRLVCDGKVVASRHINVGARNGIDGNDSLKKALKQAIGELLDENSLSERDVIRILASGMITSEFGLIELPHVNAPAGIAELHESMAEVNFPEISSIPFVFIRGIRVNSDSLQNVDIMRGEETETVGIMNDTYCIYVLPGSHSKIIEVDSKGRICRFATMLTGEMISALSQGTILKDAVDLSQSEFDTEMLNFGHAYTNEHGINNALFKTRVLKNVLKKSPKEVYSFFIGAILSDEINYIISLDPKKIVIGGKKQIREATATILSHNCKAEVLSLDDGAVEISTSLGMIKIFEYKV